MTFAYVFLLFCVLLASSASAFIANRPKMSSISSKTDDEIATTLGLSEQSSSISSKTDDGATAETVTILGLGSLLSERSSRLTFPHLQNFRLGRIPNHRRVFCHPAAIFFERGIANKETKEMSSLSCEERESSSFVCSVFEVPADEVMADPGDSSISIVPSLAYLEREEEFDIVQVEFQELSDATDMGLNAATISRGRMGVLCRKSTDDAYTKRWGSDRLEQKYGIHGIHSIWNEWCQPDSGILPCAPYLRHCVLAAKKMGPVCYDSFLDETYLADRVTTIRQYLEQRPDVMETIPPGDLAIRYGG